MTITSYRVKERCNGCHGSDRIVEFKIQPTDSGGQLIRFCYACRAELRHRLQQELKIDDAATWQAEYQRRTRLSKHPWPNTKNVRARQAAGQRVGFLESIQARPPELDEPCKATGYNNLPCTCHPEAFASRHLGPKVSKRFEELIVASSIGKGLKNIRDNGIDAELAYLESQPSFRVNHHGTRKNAAATRKKPATTRKKGIGPKARKKA